MAEDVRKKYGTGDWNLIRARQDIEQQNKIGQQEQEAFKKLAEQRLGNLSQFNASDRAREELARQQARGQATAGQRQMVGQLASQGVRGASAARAMRAGANEAAQIQSNIGREMIAGRGEREQALRQQLLSAELAGKQFGGSQFTSAIQSRLAKDAADKAAEAQKGTYLCSLAYDMGDISDEALNGDAFYGFNVVNPYTRFGYDLWARPLRPVLKANTWAYNLIKPLVVAFANEVSGVRPTLLGKAVKSIGEPICAVIGFVRARLRGIK